MRIALIVVILLTCAIVTYQALELDNARLELEVSHLRPTISEDELSDLMWSRDRFETEMIALRKQLREQTRRAADMGYQLRLCRDVLDVEIDSVITSGDPK